MRVGFLSDDLPGTWELVSRIDVTAANERRAEPSLGADPVAMLIYVRSGHFAAQFMKRDRSTPVVDAAVRATNDGHAQGGYDAYFGTYTVDDARRTVTQRLVGALSPENVGHELTRAMTVNGDSPVMEIARTAADDAAVTRTLTWKRVG